MLPFMISVQRWSSMLPFYFLDRVVADVALLLPCRVVANVTLLLPCRVVADVTLLLPCRVVANVTLSLLDRVVTNVTLLLSDKVVIDVTLLILDQSGHQCYSNSITIFSIRFLFGYKIAPSEYNYQERVVSNVTQLFL